MFAVTFTVTAPPPVPAPLPPIVSHDGALLVDVHPHPAVVCTVTDVLPADADMDSAEGWSVKTHC